MAEFKALLLEEENGKVGARIAMLPESSLPPGEVTVAVRYSTLNYKDGMVMHGLGRIVRKYPHIPGVDFAGIVEHSESALFKPGDKVIMTGWRVGEIHWGGYATKARVMASQLVHLPDGMSLEHAMAIGTAGLTAMFAVMALERHGLRPGDGEVLVTGATGGVGSVAVAVLAGLGHRVAASTGRPQTEAYLRSLGADVLVPRSELATQPTRPLDKERWAAVIDAVGNTTLATALTQVRYGGAVAACGLVGGNDLSTSIIPFLLRGISLIGIDPVMAPTGRRLEAWQRLARELPVPLLASMIQKARLEDMHELGLKILAGQIRGRIVVDLGA